MKQLKKGVAVKIKNMPLSIHNSKTRGKVGIVLDDGNRHDQYKVSIPNYKVLWLLSQFLEVISD